MKNRVLGSIFFCVLGYALSASIASAQTPELRDDRPERYTVVSGDTLWGISERFLEDPWRWKEIWKGNTQIENPDLIYPGDVIRLVFVDGKPQLVAERAGTTSTPTQAPEPTAPATTQSNSNNKKVLKTVKLTPKIYSSAVKMAIPAIPLEVINNFLSGNRIVDPDMLELAPHVLAGPEKRVILGAGDSLYSRGSFGNSIINYGVYRAGQSYIDPETKEVLGVQALDIGAANIQAKDGDIATFAITRSTGEIRVGDRLLPHEEREITSNFLPRPPEKTVQGLIMAMERGISQAGKLDIVAVNLGKKQLMEQGHILAIFRKGEKIKDRFAQPKTEKNLTLPQERAGLVLIFQVFDKMSLGIILEADRGVTLQDIVRTP